MVIGTRECGYCCSEPDICFDDRAKLYEIECLDIHCIGAPRMGGSNKFDIIKAWNAMQSMVESD